MTKPQGMPELVHKGAGLQPHGTVRTAKTNAEGNHSGVPAGSHTRGATKLRTYSVHKAHTPEETSSSRFEKWACVAAVPGIDRDVSLSIGRGSLRYSISDLNDQVDPRLRFKTWVRTTRASRDGSVRERSFYLVNSCLIWFMRMVVSDFVIELNRDVLPAWIRTQTGKVGDRLAILADQLRACVWIKDAVNFIGIWNAVFVDIIVEGNKVDSEVAQRQSRSPSHIRSDADALAIRNVSRAVRVNRVQNNEICRSCR